MLSAHIRDPRLVPPWQRLAVAALLVLSAPALTTAVAGEPALAGPKVPEPAKLERVKLGKNKFTTAPKAHPKVAQLDASARASLPAAQTATVQLPAASATSIAPVRVRAGSTPITVSRGGRAPPRPASG